MKLKAAPGLKIRDPKNNQWIPDEGIEIKELNTFWARRIQCGDAIVIDENQKVSKPKAGGGEK